MAAKKEHAAWIVGAALVGFAVEGWQGTFGHDLAHNIGIPNSGMAVVVSVIFGYIFSLFYEGAEKPKKLCPHCGKDLHARPEDPATRTDPGSQAPEPGLSTAHMPELRT